MAIIGSLFQPVPLSDFYSKLTTKWTLVEAANATRADIAAASTFVQVPMNQLAGATAGKLYQYSFTGVPQSLVDAIPSQFAVSNCHQSSVPIAEYTLGQILQWTVGINRMDTDLRQCTWRSAPPGNNCSGIRGRHRQVSNLTIGILGYGHIGEAIAVRAAAFGARLIATTLDPPAKPPAPLTWIGDDTLNPKLFAESDFIVICTPLLNSTRGLVGKELLGHLSSEAVLVNIAYDARA